MIILNDIEWGTFKKIVLLCDGDSDKCIFESTLLNGVGRFMFNAELDSDYDEFIFAYCRVDDVIEWNLSNEIYKNDNDDISNECLLWLRLLDDLMDNITLSGNDCDILNKNEFDQLCMIFNELEKYIDVNKLGVDNTNNQLCLLPNGTHDMYLECDNDNCEHFGRECKWCNGECGDNECNCYDNSIAPNKIENDNS